MIQQKSTTGRARKITYWIATIWLALGMVSTAVVQFLKHREGAGGLDSVTRLGYPVYFLTILAVWKVLGVIAVLIPRSPVLKEWAYAGFFFAMTGAIVSHLAIADPAKEIFPAVLLLALSIVSWYFRPSDRKPVTAYNTNETSKQQEELVFRPA